MESLSPDLRLGYAIVLNAVLLASAWVFVRRRVGGDWIAVGGDALLLYFLGQYLAVGLPGIVGLLSPLSIGLMVFLIAGVLVAAGWKGAAPTAAEASSPMAVASLGYTLGFMAAVVYFLGYQPVLSNDPLTYHYPAAAQWLQTGRIGLFELPNYNPANVFSPLGGSIFIAFLKAPAGHDLLSIFAQAPALVLLWFASIRISRAAGVNLAAAAIVALAIVTSQPFGRSWFLSKDDLFLVAFFASAVAASCEGSPGRPLLPWRLGTAVGLMLSIKYTALMAAPILLLIVPLRTLRWRGVAIALLSCILLAGPWYLRNWILTGNPLFPISMAGFDGLFTTVVSPALRTGSGIARVLWGRDDSIVLIVWIVAVAGMLAGAVRLRSRILFDPILRLLYLGPIVAMAIFLATSWFPESRFLGPAYVLVYLAAGVGLASIAPRWTPAACLLLLIASAATGLPSRVHAAITPIALTTAAVAAGLWWMQSHWLHLRPRTLGYIALAAILPIAMVIYVHWPAYVRNSAELAPRLYRGSYGSLADAWTFVRDQIHPADAPVAYANSYIVYPLMGFESNRPLVFVYPRNDITSIADLPRSDQPMPGDKVSGWLRQAIRENPSREKWLDGLKQAGAQYLFIEQDPNEPTLPELQWAREDTRFKEIFQNDAAIVFAIQW